MNIIFVLKASTEIGYGHLIRSRTLANNFSNLMPSENFIHFSIIGNNDLLKLLTDCKFKIDIYSTEKELIENIILLNFDIAIFDLLSIENDVFEIIRKNVKITVSISPIFNKLNEIDLFFHRTIYHSVKFSKEVEVYKGLEYALIQKDCVPIQAATFKHHLSDDHLSIAISMGGGDAANKTLEILKIINRIENKCTIWCMLGEGYKHSYDKLINETKNSPHEIILAKTNKSMWKVLNLTNLIILSGGVTSYEAAFAGLPSINIIEDESQKFLIKELIDLNLGKYLGNIDNKENEDLFINFLNLFYSNRDLLYEMHLKSKGIIDGLAADRIFEILLKKLKQK
jgi:spore coat polysaccharide biosynthesis predicted glycosyltransferase SpsG